MAVFRDTLVAAAHERCGPQLAEAVSRIAASADDPYSVSERLTSELIDSKDLS